jgi:glycosyltransferase involved in cell wall biosynthesis
VEDKKELSTMGTTGGSMSKKKIIIRGPILSRSGYGEMARLALKSLQSREDLFDIYLVATGWGNTGWIVEDDEDRRNIDALLMKTINYMQEGNTFDASVQVQLPNEWQPIAPINIGYTAGVETTSVPVEWAQVAEQIEKVITLSNHSRDAFYNSGIELKDSDVVTVGFPVREHNNVDVPLSLDYDFNFITNSQWSPRKNLENTIVSFVNEFANEDVGLIVRTSLKNNSKLDRMHTEQRLKNLLSGAPPERSCKVYLLHGDMTTDETLSLYSHPKVKAYTTLSHGEGWGLPAFEAACAGIPLIAPNWGGIAEFSTVPVKSRSKKKNAAKRNKTMIAAVKYDVKEVAEQHVWQGVINEGSKWCYADENSARQQMRQVFKGYKKYTSMALSLKNHLSEKYATEKVYAEFVQHVVDTLEENNAKMPSTTVADNEAPAVVVI